MCGSGAQRWLQWYLIIEEGVGVNGNCPFSDSVSSPKKEREVCSPDPSLFCETKAREALSLQTGSGSVS